MNPVLKFALAAGVIAFAGYQLFDYGRTVERQACKLKMTAGALASTTSALGVSETRRGQEQATTQARTEASDEFKSSILAMAEQRNAAVAAGERLRQQLSAAVQRASQCGAPGDPAAEQSRQAVAAIGAALGSCEVEQREMAGVAARAIAAGQLCAAEYDALTATNAATNALPSP